MNKIKWCFSEEKALVQFIALHRDEQVNPDSEWPFQKGGEYWEKAAKYVQEAANKDYIRSATSLRSKTGKLQQHFADIAAAEDNYGLSVDDYSGSASAVVTNEVTNEESELSLPSSFDISHLTPSQLNQLLHNITSSLSLDSLFSHIISSIDSSSVSRFVPNFITELFNVLLTHSKSTSLQLLDNLFSTITLNEGFGKSDICSATLGAMQELEGSDKNPHLVSKFAECIVKKRPNGESLMPLHRMPFGLIDYQIQFFTAAHLNQVKEPSDFKLWHQTIASETPSRVHRLIRGPMWSGLPKEEIGIPIKAKANIACTAAQSARKATEFVAKPEIQVAALETVKKTVGEERVWIKLDATDVKPGIFESKTGVWSGDVDTGDGALSMLRQEYDERLSLIDKLVGCPSSDLADALSQTLVKIDVDKQYLATQLQSASKSFQVKLKGNTTDLKLKEMSWHLVELQTLLDQCQAFQAKLHDFAKKIPEVPSQVQRALTLLKVDLQTFTRNVFKKKRVPASHFMVFMISSERRNKKPYALPVWYLPYASETDATIRTWTKRLKEAMVNCGINVVGTVTDGEFATFRYRGQNRPTHLFVVKEDCRKAVSSLSANTLKDMFYPVAVDSTLQSVIVKKPDAAVPQSLLWNIFEVMQMEKLPFEQAIYSTWTKLVPSGYTPYPFVKNKDNENLHDRMRTILATYRFRHALEDYRANGVDFCCHLYVPETDSTTGKTHHERADHNHLLKRIASAVRQGRDLRLDVEAFDKAMVAPQTGLSHAALTGLRRQSVPDAERLLSYHVADYFQQEGHMYEEEYVRTIAKWHEASDGRGLDQETRHQYNMDMLAWLRHDFMPWFSQCHNYTYMDVNRPIDDIRGLTRESVIEITTNIESQELRRLENGCVGYEEHPRAGSTDDVEAFFSICRRQVGQTFTLKAIETAWPKVVQELCKRIDENLPFYYHTSKEPYEVEEQQSFDAPVPENSMRLHQLKINKREDSSIFVAGRCLLPVRNKTSIRQRLHTPEGPLPPVPSHMKLNYC